jgi:hypothetical protein
VAEIREQQKQASTVEQERMRKALRAERERLEGVIGEARQEVARLREATTGGAASRWLGVPMLLAGIAFTTWPDGIAVWWPGWLSASILGLVVACCIAAGLYWAIWAELGES